MNIAIVGSSGYIARYLESSMLGRRAAERIYRIGRHEQDHMYLDLSQYIRFDYNQLQMLDFIIFAAAVSSPDQCKNEFQKSWNINVTGTEFFIYQALQRNCKVIFLSSDAVFGADIGEAFDEYSETKADSSYGIMKKRIEDTFCQNINFKTVRLSYVVSAEDRFAKYCRECMVRKREAEIFHPFYRNCITVGDVSEIIGWLIKNWKRFKPGCVNAAGTELVSRIRIADEINRLFNGRLNYKIVAPDLGFFSERHEIIQMKSRFIEKYGMVKTANFTEKFAAEWKGVCL